MRASPHQPMSEVHDAFGEIGGARLVDEEIVVVELDRVRAPLRHQPTRDVGRALG